MKEAIFDHEEAKERLAALNRDILKMINNHCKMSYAIQDHKDEMVKEFRIVIDYRNLDGLVK